MSQLMKPNSDLRHQLLTKARELASERGWPLQEPIEVLASMEEGEQAWIVHSNYMGRGNNVKIVFRQSDCSLVRAAYLPR